VATKYVTEAELGKTLEKIGELTRQAITEEMSKAMKWRGTWRPGSYKMGDTVNDKSSMWSCVAPETAARPGSGAGWQLLFKTKAEAAK
jgi:hypothetical protein